MDDADGLAPAISKSGRVIFDDILILETNVKTKIIAAVLGLTFSAAASAGSVLIINGASGTSEPSTTSAITTNLQTLHTAAGNTVTIADGVPVSLAGYAQVWDIRFSNNFGLTASDSALYTSFLQGGGGIFLMGENGGFMDRNNSILSLINDLGGGSIGFDACYDGPENIHAPFTGPNPVSVVDFAASGCFTGTGTGDWIASRADNSEGAGIAFGVGDLANAPAGALTTILDVNFMQNLYDLPNSQNLTKNLIQFVGNQVNPTPEPGTAALLGLAFAGLLAGRRRKQ